MIATDPIPKQPRPVFETGHTSQRMQAIPDTFNLLHEKSLRPYDNNELLGQRLISPNRLLRRLTAIQEVISDALLDDSDESILDAATIIVEGQHEIAPANQPPVAAILSYLNLVDHIAQQKNTIQGTEAPFDRVNAISILVSRELGKDIPDDSLEDYFLSVQYLSARMPALQETYPSNDYNFITAKLHTLSNILYMRRMGMIYAEDIPDHDLTTTPENIIEQHDEEVTQLFEQMRSSSSYGLKLAYSSHRLGGSFIYSEPLELDFKGRETPNVHHLATDTPAVAEVIHSAKRSFKNLKPTVEIKDENVLAANYSDLEPVGMLYVGPKGELYADRHCTFSLKDIFTHTGKYYAYRELQADVLAGYFDLTQPGETVIQAKRNISENASASNKNEALDVIRNLIVPRIQCLKDEQPQNDAETSSHRSVREHEVVLHRRQLPEGWHPSPEALQLAANSGIKLEPGETVVKAHTRGSEKLGRVVAHQLVSRPKN